MRNKFKKILKQEKGFTLVELLAVIVILGIIVAIAIPAVGSIINRAGDQADDAEIELIIDAARLYHMQLPDGEDWSTTGTVHTDKLVSEGFLEGRGDEEPIKGTVTYTAASGSDPAKYEFSKD